MLLLSRSPHTLTFLCTPSTSLSLHHLLTSLPPPSPSLSPCHRLSHSIHFPSQPLTFPHSLTSALTPHLHFASSHSLHLPSLQFMELMQQRYHQEAVDAGVHLVSSCGFDSIPNDLGVVFTEQQFKGELQYVESFMKVDRHGQVRVHACMHVCACVCVCVCACACVCMCAYVHMYLCVCLCLCACVCVCAYIRMYVRMCICVHVCACVYVCMCVCVRVCICVHVCAYVPLPVCVCVRVCMHVCVQCRIGSLSCILH